ncbi:MAG: glycosyltransferase [Anaerolinea sp.]|nr:glycosyltransferase [Anaerolinea sp.]
MIPLLRTHLDRWALPLGLLGLAAVAVYNARLWPRDRAFLAARPEPQPLPPLEAWPDLPLVSVLVAAWNEAAHVERHIASFQALRYPHKELVLCAGGDDGTYALASRLAGPAVRVLRQAPGEGKQRALARAFPEARGEIIFLTDADCLLADEPFERTLWPVAAGAEQVTTGGSRPFDQQLADPFVFTQAAAPLYASLHGPEYASGILGRNCAARRALLAQTAALDAPAPTGTDYVLAKTLLATGARIRHAPESLMPTEYPTTARAYLRQQRRWLRNVALHGRRFGALDEARASLQSSLVGLAMLLWPGLGLLLSPWLLAVWGILVGQALFARLRYLSFAGAVLKRPVQPADVSWQGPLLLLDFVAWAQPLVDYLRSQDRWRW